MEVCSIGKKWRVNIKHTTDAATKKANCWPRVEFRILIFMIKVTASYHKSNYFRDRISACTGECTIIDIETLCSLTEISRCFALHYLFSFCGT